MDRLRTAPELEALRNRPRRLLAVFPHPDDESYGCAGALHRLGTDPEGAAVLICLTRGEASSMGPSRGLSPDQVGDLRAERMERVADLLHLDGLLLDRLPDGGMTRMRLDHIARPIAEAVAALRPQVVVGHCSRGVNAHKDHIATHWGIRHALLDFPDVRFAMVVYDEDFAKSIPRLLFPTPESDVDVRLSLSEDEVRAKEACLRIHEAYVTFDDDADPELIRRPPEERYDVLGEDRTPPAPDLFA